LEQPSIPVLTWGFAKTLVLLRESCREGAKVRKRTLVIIRQALTCERRFANIWNVSSLLTALEDTVHAYGRAKSSSVERQFMLSLVQTAEGQPIVHEVHPGNTAEAKTMLPMIRGLLER
jgi:hypothetical protein